MFKNFSDDGVEKTDNITIVKTQKSLEDFKSMFDSKVNDFVKKIMELNVLVNESNRDLTQEDFETESEKVKVFSMYYNNLEKFKKENFIFEIENQHIDMTKWFWNDEFIHEYEIHYLHDWVKMKEKETSNKPEYRY